MHTHFLTNLQILIIDCEEATCAALYDFVINHGGQALTANYISKALSTIELTPFDCIICDVSLNGEGSGIDLAEQIKIIDPDTTIILTTNKDIEQLIQIILLQDLYALVPKPVDFKSFGLLLMQAAKSTRNKRQNKHYSNQLKNQLLGVRTEKDKIFINTLAALTTALEQKDEYTRNHSEVVSDIANKIAWEFTDNVQFIDDVTIAGKLHDLGKIGIRDDILFKKEKLSNDEYNIIKTHPEMSYKIVRPVDVIGKFSSYVLHHHEHYNGSGYPHGLKEKGIPAGSRIISVADSYNAITSKRPYRDPINKNTALEIITESSNTQFDPEIVDILYKLVKINKV